MKLYICVAVMQASANVAEAAQAVNTGEVGFAAYAVPILLGAITFLLKKYGSK